MSASAAGPAARASQETGRRLRIVHCFRSAVGGLFRHVRDLAEMQHRAGHQVGIICDSSTGGDFEEEIFRRIAPTLALGLHRLPIAREISLSDTVAVARVFALARRLNPDVLHAHGAKGGAYARTAGTLLRASGSSVARIYTPHGGSMHYDSRSLRGRLYFTVERTLGRVTDAFIFVSRYEADAYAAKVGRPQNATVAPNGLRAGEFEPVKQQPDARDFLFIGMMREAKGPGDFIAALAAIRDRTGRAPSAWMVGSGDEKAKYEARVADLGLAGAVSFRDPMPPREAFARARVVVAPSRNESLPYLILESIAAGMPTIATNVGGLPEIFGAEAGNLLPPADPARLADAMMTATADPAGAAALAGRLKAYIRPRFAVEAMAATVSAAYRSVVAAG